jgi:type IX secretion system PorP/SprF family membrane protein
MIKLKNLLILIFLLSINFVVLGQQRPQYTQYATNNYLLNPAISGIERYIDVKMGKRNQWTGLNDAPVTSYFSIQMPLGLAPDLYGENSMNRSYTENYKAPDPHHGIGVYAIFDQPGGPITSTDVDVTYAYHVGLSYRMTLSLGVAVGASKVVLDQSRISTADNFDPAIASGSLIVPDLGAGAWLYGPTYFAGISFQGLLGRPITFSSANTINKGEQATHVFLTSGYKFFIGDDFALIPSFMIKYVNPAPLTFDINSRFAFKDKFWIGGSYRKDDAFAAMAGFNLGSLFNFSYSYDFSTSKIGNLSAGSHEFVLGIRLNNRFKVTCPQENW